MSDQAELKRAAAEAAVDAEVRSGMCLGLGSGSTATLMLDALADRLRDGRLADVSGVPTSEATAARCRELGIALHTLDERSRLDVAIDGADEIDPELRLIKGLGGAHLREKVVAAAADRFAVVADESKLVSRLGERAPLPVEVVRFAEAVSARLLRDLGWQPDQRQRDGDAVGHRRGQPYPRLPPRRLERARAARGRGRSRARRRRARHVPRLRERRLRRDVGRRARAHR